MVQKKCLLKKTVSYVYSCITFSREGEERGLRLFIIRV